MLDLKMIFQGTFLGVPPVTLEAHELRRLIAFVLLVSHQIMLVLVQLPTQVTTEWPFGTVT